MQLSIQHNFPQVMTALKTLNKEVADKALVSAVNKTIEQGRTQMSKGITAEYNIKAAKVKESLRVTKARRVGGNVAIEATLESPSQRGRSLNVINFAARQTKAGVSIQIKRSAGRKVLRSAFIANQGRTVFKRVGKSRLPIKAIQTIEVASMFNAKRINSVVVKFLEDKLPQVFESEARFFLNKFNTAKA